MTKSTGVRALKQGRLGAVLRRTGGNMAAAARVLGMNRNQVSEMVGRNPELQQLMREVVEESNDDMEAKLKEIAEKGNVVAVLATLNAKARDRGYTRNTSDVAVSGYVDHRHHVHVEKSGSRLQDMSYDELVRNIQERRAALAAAGCEPPRHPLMQYPDYPRPDPAPLLIEGEVKDVTPKPEKPEGK